MKILCLYFGHKGGGSQYSINCAEELNKICELYVAYSDKNQHVDRFNKFERRFRVNGFTTKWQALRFLLLLPLLIIRLRKFICTEKIEFVYLPMTQIFSGIIVLFLKLTTSVKIIFTMHDAATHDERHNWIKQFLLRIDIFACDGVLFVSDYVKDSTMKRYFEGLPNETAPFGKLNATRAEIDRSWKPIPNILFFGRIEKYKGLDLFVESLEILSKANKNFNFTIAGSGIICDRTREKIDQLKKLHQGLLVNRWISDSELHDLHLCADILVVPYLEASQSGVLASAQDYVIPFVCTNVGALPEQALGQGGFVADQLTPIDFADSICLLFNKSNYIAKVKEIKEFNRHVSWLPSAKAVVSIAYKLKR